MKPEGPTLASLNVALDASEPTRDLGRSLDLQREDENDRGAQHEQAAQLAASPASSLLELKRIHLAQTPAGSSGAPTAPTPPIPGEKPSSVGSLKAFMDAIHTRESMTPGVGRGPGYLAENAQGYLGRYQLGPAAQRDVGLVDAQGRWTGKNGVRSKDDFLNNPQAQDRAFAEYIRQIERQLKSNGAARHIGRVVQGVLGQFKVTEAGLAAAAHRQGAGAVAKYLFHLQSRGWKSDAASLPLPEGRDFPRIEKRLREFEHVPYR